MNASIFETAGEPGSVAIPLPRRRLATRFLLPVMLVIATVGLILGASWRSLIPVLEVSGVPVVVKSVDAPVGGSSLTATGWIEPDPYPTHATPLVQGVVSTVEVLEGDEVVAGDVLARLIDEDARIALDAALDVAADVTLNVAADVAVDVATDVAADAAANVAPDATADVAVDVATDVADDAAVDGADDGAVDGAVDGASNAAPHNSEYDATRRGVVVNVLHCPLAILTTFKTDKFQNLVHRYCVTHPYHPFLCCGRPPTFPPPH